MKIVKKKKDGTKEFKEIDDKPKETKKEQKQRLHKFGNKLNENLPKSEEWFKEKFMETRMTFQFRWNKPLGPYIPDLVNYDYRVCIEIDGSIHRTPEQIIKDKKKDIYYKKRQYTCIRIIAYDNESFWKGIEQLRKVIEKEKPRLKRKAQRKEFKKWLTTDKPHYIKKK